jgi:hemoglobin
MRRILRLIVVLLAMTPLTGGSLAQDTLYQRLGGYDAIAALADDFVDRLLRDPTFERFFAGFSKDSKAHIRQLIVDFVCEKTGGPCVYTGRDMKTAHQGIGITKEEWDKALVLFGQSMTALRIPGQEAQDLATLIVPLEADIVEQR